MTLKYTGTKENYDEIKKALYKEVVVQHFVKDIAVCDNNVIVGDTKLIKQYLMINNAVQIDTEDYMVIEDGRLKSTFREK